MFPPWRHNRSISEEHRFMQRKHLRSASERRIAANRKSAGGVLVLVRGWILIIVFLSVGCKQDGNKNNSVAKF